MTSLLAKTKKNYRMELETTLSLDELLAVKELITIRSVMQWSDYIWAHLLSKHIVKGIKITILTFHTKINIAVTVIIIFAILTIPCFHNMKAHWSKIARRHNWPFDVGWRAMRDYFLQMLLKCFDFLIYWQKIAIYLKALSDPSSKNSKLKYFGSF